MEKGPPDVSWVPGAPGGGGEGGSGRWLQSDPQRRDLRAGIVVARRKGSRKAWGRDEARPARLRLL